MMRMQREDLNNWENAEFQDFLQYVQPTNYIVESTDYDDSYKTPVLTAGKTFIKGYTNEESGIFNDFPVIIFDDFTTATKYVSFPFKVKSSAMKILLPTSKLVNLKFMYHCMQVNRIRSDTHKRYWISVYAKKRLQLPPLPEQRAIVAKIEQLFGALDQGVQSLEKAQTQLKIYRQAVFKKAFEGELTKAWREAQTDLPTADELLEEIQLERERYYGQQMMEWEEAVTAWESGGKVGRKPGKPRKKKEQYQESGKNVFNFPVNWVDGIMENVAEAIDPQPSHRTPPVDENGIPYISIADIDKTSGKINFDSARRVGVTVLQEHINRYKLIQGDFVIGKIGTIGKPFFIPSKRFFTLSANVVLVQPLRVLANPKFLFYLSLSPIIEQQFTSGAKATTQAAFGIKKVRLLRVPICSLEEQHQIVQEIESRLSVCDKLEESIQENLKKAEALRQSILKKAFEGRLLSEAELAACRQEADWEPAADLLARIKEEKN